MSDELGRLRNSIERCNRRLERAAEKYKKLSVMLVHFSQLGNKPDPYWPEFATQGNFQINVLRGPYCDWKKLFDDNGAPAVGGRAFIDLDGNEMVYSDGSPIAIYPGAQHTSSLYGAQLPGLTEASYSEAAGEYVDTAEVLGQLLNDFPAKVKKTIWREWPYGFNKMGESGFWTSGVFELAFQQHPATRLVAERWVWRQPIEGGPISRLKTSTLAEIKARPELQVHKQIREIYPELIENAGNPPAYWYSWIENIWEASIAAADLLLEWLPNSTADSDAGPTETADATADQSNESTEARAATLTPKIEQAWLSWKLAEENNPDKLTDRAAYDWLKEQEFNAPLVGYELPEFSTWKRYVGKGRTHHGEQKNHPRAGRADGSRSIARHDEL